jgi:hypothetical protein
VLHIDMQLEKERDKTRVAEEVSKKYEQTVENLDTEVEEKSKLIEEL